MSYSNEVTDALTRFSKTYEATFDPELRVRCRILYLPFADGSFSEPGWRVFAGAELVNVLERLQVLWDEAGSGHRPNVACIEAHLEQRMPLLGDRWDAVRLPSKWPREAMGAPMVWRVAEPSYEAALHYAALAAIATEDPSDLAYDEELTTAVASALDRIGEQQSGVRRGLGRTTGQRTQRGSPLGRLTGESRGVTLTASFAPHLTPNIDSEELSRFAGLPPERIVIGSGEVTIECTDESEMRRVRARLEHYRLPLTGHPTSTA